MSVMLQVMDEITMMHPIAGTIATCYEDRTSMVSDGGRWWFKSGTRTTERANSIPLPTGDERPEKGWTSERKAKRGRAMNGNIPMNDVSRTLSASS